MFNVDDACAARRPEIGYIDMVEDRDALFKEENSDLDPILSRTRSHEYLNIQGLSAITGCQKEYLDTWILKELIDNALDACNADKVEHPIIDVKITRINNTVNISVQDNGPGLTHEDLKKIVDFTHMSSSKFYQKKPQRGFMGNAMKAILGIPYALAQLHGQVPPVKIYSKNYCHTIRLRETHSDKVTANIESVKSDIPGTIVQVSLPPINKYWGRNQQYLDLVRSYSVFNPNTSFTITLQNEQEKTARKYLGKQPPSKTFTGKPSIHWSTLEEFRKHTQAIRETLPMTIEHFISSFFGFSKKARRAEILDPNNINPETDLNKICKTTIDTIYNTMIKSRKPSKPEQLTHIGEENILATITTAFSKPLKHKYKSITTNHIIDEVSYPSRIEVLIATLDEKTRIRRIVVGINQTPMIDNPLRAAIFSGSKKKDATYHGIHAFLESLNIKEKDPVFVLIHVSTPNPSYENYGKTRLNMEPFLEPLTMAVETAGSFYYRFKRGNKRIGEKSYARKLLIIELKRRARLREKLGYIPDNQRVTMQSLFYMIRKQMGGETGIKRKSFIAAIKPECEALGYKRLHLGIITTVRAELHFRGKDYPISYDNLDMLAELGSDIIVVEKEGISLALSPWADKYGVALLTSRGFLVEYAQELIELMRNKRANLFLLTDYDAAGISISTKVSKVPRIGVDFRTHIELGLSFDSVVEEYKPKKNVLRDVPGEHLWFLSTRRIEIDSILSAAGQEIFWKHLMEKMVMISPIRDLNRSILLDIRLPEEVQKGIVEIEKSLSEPAYHLKTDYQNTFENWGNGFVSVLEIEDGIQRKLAEKIRGSKSFKTALNHLKALVSVLDSQKKTE